jgi:DNA-directed RNA polymerase subunit K/omega
LENYIVNPVSLRAKESEKGSIYQSIVALGFRTRQINDDIKMELDARLADVMPTEETEAANFEQIAISKEFDKLPKPTFLAMKELSEDKLVFDLPVKDK